MLIASRRPFSYLQCFNLVVKASFQVFRAPNTPTLFCSLTMVNLSRLQTMQTCCWVSGIQSLRAGGLSGGWNLPGERPFLLAEPRSFSLSVLLEEGVCVGVLPASHHRGGNRNRTIDKKETNTGFNDGFHFYFLCVMCRMEKGGTKHVKTARDKIENMQWTSFV